MTTTASRVVFRTRESPSGEQEAESQASNGIDPAALVRALEAIADREASVTERFYEIFFDRRPDTRELFGPHSLAEQEEMMRETLHSIHALCEDRTWLADNLAALGRSHREYGVTSDMYPVFVEAFVESSRAVLGATLGDLELHSLRLATREITRQMSEAGERVSVKRSG